MREPTQNGECPANLISGAVSAVGKDQIRGLAQIESLVLDYPYDARLHFLRGSLLAGLQRYGEAHEAMSRAVKIAPQYAVARFQLGFLELTSGDPAAAEVTWSPLQDLSPDDALRIFVLGLNHLIRDEFGQAIDVLTEGIAKNVENPTISNDMQLIIEKAGEALGAQQSTDEPISSAHLLLQQYASKMTKH